MMRKVLAILGVLVVAQPAVAADYVVSLGYSSFSGSNQTDSAVLGLEVHSNPLWQWAGADWSLAGAADIHRDREFWVGVGVSAMWRLRQDWFVEASVMPGHYDAGKTGNSLGSSFEIRSLLGVGRKLNDRVSLSLAVTHKSNASTARSNPGVNALLLRTRWSF